MDSSSDLGRSPLAPPASWASNSDRVPLLDIESLNEDQRALRNLIVRGPRSQERSTVPLTDAHGRLLGPFGLMLLAPRVGNAVQAVGAALRFGTAMSERCRELGILTIASELQSAFEWLAHSAAAVAHGITERQLRSLMDSEIPDGLNATESLTVSVCRELLRSGDLSDQKYADTIELVGTDGLAELVWLVGYYSSLALALRVFNPPLEELDQ